MSLEEGEHFFPQQDENKTQVGTRKPKRCLVKQFKGSSFVIRQADRPEAKNNQDRPNSAP